MGTRIPSQKGGRKIDEQKSEGGIRRNLQLEGRMRISRWQEGRRDEKE